MFTAFRVLILCLSIDCEMTPIKNHLCGDYDPKIYDTSSGVLCLFVFPWRSVRQSPNPSSNKGGNKKTKKETIISLLLSTYVVSNDTSRGRNRRKLVRPCLSIFNAWNHIVLHEKATLHDLCTLLHINVVLTTIGVGV